MPKLRVLIAAVVLTCSAFCSAQDHYLALRLDPRESTQEAWARGINDRNMVVGDWKFFEGSNEMRRGFFWHSGNSNPKMKILGTLGGTSGYRWTFVNDINNEQNARIVGKSRNPNGTYKAFQTFANSYSTLNALGDGGGTFAWDSEALAVNDNGVIVGWGRIGSASGMEKPFRYGSSMALLGLAAGASTVRLLPAVGGAAIETGHGRATGITNGGRICGFIQRSSTTGQYRAFWCTSTGNLRELPIPSGHVSSEAHGINNSNVIVGLLRTTGNGDPIACRWVPTGAETYACEILPNTLGQAANAKAINDAGIIVGGVKINGAFYGYVFEGGAMVLADQYQGPSANYSADGRFIRLLEAVSNSAGLPAFAGYGINPAQGNRSEALIMRKSFIQNPPPPFTERNRAIGSVLTTGGSSQIDYSPGSGPLNVVGRLDYDGSPDFVPESQTVSLQASDPDVAITPASGTVGLDLAQSSVFQVTPGPSTAGKTIYIRVIGRGYHPDSGRLQINVAKYPTTLSGSDLSGRTRETIQLSATLLRQGQAAPGRIISFQVAGQSVGSATTNASGLATLSYKIPDTLGAGDHVIRATYAGSSSETSAQINRVLTVTRGDLAISVDSFTASPRAMLNLTARVRSAQDNQAVGPITVNFTVGGVNAGAANTTSAGIATLAYTVPDEAAGMLEIRAATHLTPSYVASSGAGTLSIQPTLVGLSVSPSEVVGGMSTTGKVSLSGQAIGSGSEVSLTSGSSAIIVAGTVTVPAGSSSTTFPIQTQAVANTATRSITARLGAVTLSASLTLTPGLQSLAVSPSTVPGGTSTMGTVRLFGPAPGRGQNVAISSNSFALLVPASVTVAGGSTTATFEVRTVPVGVTSTRTVSATLGPVTRSANVTITTSLSRLTISPDRITGGQSTSGTVYLTGAAPSGGLTITLSSGSSVIQVPNTVTVPAGASSVSFAITTQRVGFLATRYVTATLGSTSRQAPLTLTP